MSDDAREYLKAAQTAELRGDVGQAVENLKKAATLYRQAGKPARALQMLRHAKRLDGSRRDVLDELARYEWIPEQPMADAAAGETGDEVARALEPLDSIETSFIVPDDKKLIERGPTRADPAIPAWCSFCCRPIKEVGPLVAGPAGAFICGACVREARRLLVPDDPSAAKIKPVLGPPSSSPQATKTDAAHTVSWQPQPTILTAPHDFAKPPAPPRKDDAARTPTDEEVPSIEAKPTEFNLRASTAEAAASLKRAVCAVAPAVAPTAAPSASELERSAAPAGAPDDPADPPKPPEPPPVEFTGQPEAVKVLDAAMRLNVKLVLLIGPEGCGKTAYLRDLERRGLGVYADDASAAAEAPKERRLLIDAGGTRPGRLAEEDLPWLLDLIGDGPSRQVIVAVRGDPPAAAFSLKSDDTELPMFSTRELVEATGGRLPAALASQVQVTAPFRDLSVEELSEVCRRLMGRRSSELDLSDELLAALADEASKSGRGGRELESLVARLPAGSWNLQSAPKVKRSRKSRRKSDPKEP